MNPNMIWLSVDASLKISRRTRDSDIFFNPILFPHLISTPYDGNGEQDVIGKLYLSLFLEIPQKSSLSDFWQLAQRTVASEPASKSHQRGSSWSQPIPHERNPYPNIKRLWDSKGAHCWVVFVPTFRTFGYLFCVALNTSPNKKLNRNK